MHPGPSFHSHPPPRSLHPFHLKNAGRLRTLAPGSPYACRGDLLNASSETYLIPTVADVPRVFNVHLLPHAPNPMAVHSSKAVGEPPFFLSASVFFAIKVSLYASPA